MDDLPIVAAGRTIPDAIDRIRRYCGLPWSGGAPETWAWHYYDCLPTNHDNTVTVTDVLAAAALHRGLARPDLAFFRERSSEVSRWMARLDPELTLRQANDADLDHVASLTEFEAAVPITLLSKVLHRKRPNLIPLLDRHVIDWYRPLTGERSAVLAWAPLLRAMRSDLADRKGSVAISVAHVSLERELGTHHYDDQQGRILSWLRMLDIAIWMGSR